MKMLDGSLAEKLYSWPHEDNQQTNQCEQNMLSPRKISEFYKNEVTYINGMNFYTATLIKI